MRRPWELAFCAGALVMVALYACSRPDALPSGTVTSSGAQTSATTGGGGKGGQGGMGGHGGKEGKGGHGGMGGHAGGAGGMGGGMPTKQGKAIWGYYSQDPNSAAVASAVAVDGAGNVFLAADYHGVMQINGKVVGTSS